ncbi:MAG: beta-phosphoglucomutase [Erysipelotrichaceae bacterium]|jgi:beta-phosphoglucomutase
MIKGLIFDLDGVIVSTDRFHFQAWSRLAEELNLEFDEKINNKLRGVSRLESLNIILNEKINDYSLEEKEKLADKKNSIYIQLLKNLKPSDVADGFKDVYDYAKLHKIKTSIGSSSRNTKTILKFIGLENNFDAIIDGNMISNSKPNPEVFIKAATAIECFPSECLVVEDALSGLMAAKAAGMISAGIGNAVTDKNCDYKISNLRDLIKIIKNHSKEVK